jgi:RNA polymerase sigma-70 factor (ECF subfamily)
MLEPITNNEDPYLEKTDEDLIVLTFKNKESYRYLMQRYEEKLKRYIIRLSGAQKEDAEDILQNVFLKAYRNLKDFDKSLKFSSWIYRIAHNETVTFLRKKNVRPKTIDPETASIIISLIGSDLGIEEAIDKKNLSEKIKEIINTLDEDYRNVILLKYMEEKDYREISDILKKPMGTIATLLKRGKEKLKKEILKQTHIF